MRVKAREPLAVPRMEPHFHTLHQCYRRTSSSGEAGRRNPTTAPRPSLAFNPNSSRIRQTIEHRPVRRVDLDAHVGHRSRIGNGGPGIAAGNQTHAQRIGLGLEPPALVVRRP